MKTTSTELNLLNQYMSGCGLLESGAGILLLAFAVRRLKLNKDTKIKGTPSSLALKKVKGRWEDMIKWLYIVVIVVLLLMTQANVLTKKYNKEVQGLLGTKDCTFITKEYNHVWKEACTITVTGVEIRNGKD
jgi:hypothetical protein